MNLKYRKLIELNPWSRGPLEKLTRPQLVKKLTSPQLVKKLTGPQLVKKLTGPQLVKKLTSPQLVKKLPALYAFQLITCFERGHHFSPCPVR